MCHCIDRSIRSRAVFCEWWLWHNPFRLSHANARSGLSRLAILWSTSVAGSVRPTRAHSVHSGLTARYIARRRLHRLFAVNASSYLTAPALSLARLAAIRSLACAGVVCTLAFHGIYRTLSIPSCWVSTLPPLVAATSLYDHALAASSAVCVCVRLNLMVTIIPLTVIVPE
jgi:hypothetical protein